MHLTFLYGQKSNGGSKSFQVSSGKLPCFSGEFRGCGASNIGFRHCKNNNLPKKFFITFNSSISSIILLQDVLLIDEIGKMELFSKAFKKRVTDIFYGSSNKAFVIGTIPQIHKVPQQHTALFEKLHADERIEIVNVTHGNRNNLPEEIIRYFT